MLAPTSACTTISSMLPYCSDGHYPKPHRIQSLSRPTPSSSTGMAYIILFSKWLLPGDDAADDLNSALYVPNGSYAAGKTAKNSGLYGGKLQLTGLSRNNTPAIPFSPDVQLQTGDVVYVTGGWLQPLCPPVSCASQRGCCLSCA